MRGGWEGGSLPKGRGLKYGEDGDASARDTDLRSRVAALCAVTKIHLPDCLYGDNISRVLSFGSPPSALFLNSPTSNPPSLPVLPTAILKHLEAGDRSRVCTLAPYPSTAKDDEKARRRCVPTRRTNTLPPQCQCHALSISDKKRGSRQVTVRISFSRLPSSCVRPIPSHPLPPSCCRFARRCARFRYRYRDQSM